MQNQDKFYEINDLIKKNGGPLPVSRQGLYTAAKKKEIPAIRIGRRVLISSRWIEKILSLPDESEQAPPSTKSAVAATRQTRTPGSRAGELAPQTTPAQETSTPVPQAIGPAAQSRTPVQEANEPAPQASNSAAQIAPVQEASEPAPQASNLATLTTSAQEASEPVPQATGPAPTASNLTEISA